MSIEEVIDRAIMAQQSIEIEYCTRNGRVFTCEITNIGYSNYYGGGYNPMVSNESDNKQIVETNMEETISTRQLALNSIECIGCTPQFTEDGRVQFKLK